MRFRLVLGTMRSPSSLKREFLKKWIMGLQLCKSWNKNKNMSVLERKKAIKLSADIAMASVRNGATCWSRALISDSSRDHHDQLLVQRMLGAPSPKRKTSICSSSSSIARKIKKMSTFRRCGGFSRRGRRRGANASCVAKRLVRKRTQVLKRLVPGGRFMHGIALIEETLDYIVALRAQVDVMRSLAGASQMVNVHEN